MSADGTRSPSGTAGTRVPAHFARIPEWMLDSDLTHGAVRLYGILDRYCGDDHSAFPSRTTLAARMRCNRTTVDRFLVELVEAGAVKVTRRKDKAGDPTTNLYYLVARAQLPSRTDATTSSHGYDHGGGTDATTGSCTDAAQNESPLEREPLVCVDLACSKLSTDTPKQHDEARVKVAALVAIHGEDAVRSELDAMPDACIPFGGELDRILKARLGDVKRIPSCERCNDTGQTSTGYPCGCPGTTKWRAS